MKPVTHRTKARGMTLTEVVVASVLLVVAVVPVLRALTIAEVTGRIVEYKTQSLILARGKLDRIRAQSIYHYDDSFQEDDGALTGSYLCNVTDDRDSDLRLVTVSVGFDADGDGRLSDDEVHVTLATYIAKDSEAFGRTTAGANPDLPRLMGRGCSPLSLPRWVPRGVP